MTEEKNEEITNKVKTGKFLPKKKFLGFIAALKSGVRLLSDKATIDGKQLSGMLENINFEITLYPDGTIDFIEIGTNSTTPEMIQRLIDDISDRDVTGYTGKFIIHGLTFKVVKNEEAEKNTIKISDNTICYLEVEHEKPIDRLFSLINDEEKPKIDNPPQPSEKALSALDSLFDNIDTYDTKESSESKDIVNTTVTVNNVASNYLADSLRIMNEEKILELRSRIEKGVKEITKTQFELKTAENKIIKLTEDLGVLNTRLETMTPADDPNGWLFFISEEKKSDIEADEKTKEVVEKISPILKLEPDKVLLFLTEGYFTINLGMKEDIEKKDFKLPSDILQKISKIDPSGKIAMISESEFEYRGKMNWHQLVSKMIRMGFEQSPDFEKLCGSNSYSVSKPEAIKENDPKGTKIEKFNEFESTNEDLMSDLDDMERV